MSENLAPIGPPARPDQIINSNEDETMSEAQNLKNPTDSGASDSDSGDEAADNLQLQTLEAELSTNPANYDAHVQYIKALRKQGEIEKLRKAREAMNALFPLSPAMWQEWAKDETSLSTGNDGFPAIEKVYERGVLDYLSVSLWCDYINFVQEYDPSVRECSPAGTSKARNLFERALTAAGLHVSWGSKIWEAYIKFEQAVLHAIDETDIESREKQVQRIRNIFHRQLSVPLADLKQTLLTYKAWEAEQGTTLDVHSSNLDGISSHVASAYQKALEMFNARATFEEQVSKQDLPDSERLQQFMNYLSFEESTGDPARVQILYERAITEFPISTELWLEYTRYLDKTLKATRIVRDVYHRASRNCSWVGELWVRYLLSLERGHASEREISDVYEKATQCTFSSFDEYLNIFLTRVDGLRRRISFAGEVTDGLDYALIRDTFQHASGYLSQQLKNTESLLQMHRYWARLESNLANDFVAARGVWESLLKSSGSMLEAWQGYIAMEIEKGHINEARSLYRRCYSKRFPGMGSEDICHSWIRFEREFGTLEDFDHAVQKVTPRLEELRLFRLHQESTTVATFADQKENALNKNAREKRKAVSEVIDEQSPAKRQKDTSQTSKKVFEKDKAQVKSSVETNKMENPTVQASKPDSASDNKAKGLNPELSKQYNDQCTAFLSNLSFQATDEDLRNFFSDVGGVESIRLLKDKYTKKPRGLAYVDFSDDAHLSAALEKNRQLLLGKRVSIARSNPKQSKKRGSAGHGTSTEHGHDSKASVHISEGTRGDDNVQLKGKNTFAVPRNVRPLGWTSKDKSTLKPKPEGAVEGGDEAPKSNDEFRKMLIKS